MLIQWLCPFHFQHMLLPVDNTLSGSHFMLEYPRPDVTPTFNRKIIYSTNTFTAMSQPGDPIIISRAVAVERQHQHVWPVGVTSQHGSFIVCSWPRQHLFDDATCRLCKLVDADLVLTGETDWQEQHLMSSNLWVRQGIVEQVQTEPNETNT